MAASLNQMKARAFKQKLDQLSCPYAEGVEDSWITELIFKPGEARIRLLQWLFSKFDSRLNEVLDPQYASMESKMDSRIQRLLYVASTLGLCRYDDVDLIRGAVPASKQSMFMEQLIDLVCIAEAAEDPQNKLFKEPGLVCKEMCLSDQLLHDSAYLNSLCDQGNIDAIFNPRLMLLPPDIQKQVEKSWQEKGHLKDKPPRPDFQAIEEQALKLADDIQRQKDLLQDLRKLNSNQSHDTSWQETVCKTISLVLSELSQLITGQETVCKTISLVLSELSQLITGFTYCYENELRHWCNKSPPALTQLGPAFKRVHRLLQQFVQMLQSFKAIRGSYTALNRDTPDRIAELANSESIPLSLVGAGEEALASLEQVVDILEESIQHSEAMSSVQTTPRSARSQASTLKMKE